LSSDGILRIFFQNNSTTYFHSGNTGSDGFHFRNFTQSDIFTINGNDNVSSTGTISCSSITTSSGYSYFNGLRIMGTDTGNPIYQATGNLGISTNTTNINLGMNTYGVRINIIPTNTTIYNNLILNCSMTFKTDVWHYSSEGNQKKYFGNAGTTYNQGYGQYVLNYRELYNVIF
jgi:hypothetical protein